MKIIGRKLLATVVALVMLLSVVPMASIAVVTDIKTVNIETDENYIICDSEAYELYLSYSETEPYNGWKVSPDSSDNKVKLSIESMKANQKLTFTLLDGNYNPVTNIEGYTITGEVDNLDDGAIENPLTFTAYNGFFKVNFNNFKDKVDSNHSAITIKIKKNDPVTVTLDDDVEGYSMAPANNTNTVTSSDNGNYFDFYVNANRGYNLPESAKEISSFFSVKTISSPEKDASTSISKMGTNLFRLSGITESVKVSINGDDFVQKFNVTLPIGEGYTAKFDGDNSGESTVEVSHGKSISFTVTADTGYEVKSVSYNNVAITELNNKYTINPVTASGTVVITAVRNTYTVNISTDEGKGTAYTTTATEKTGVAHGTDYTFTVTPKEGYANPTVEVYKTEEPLENKLTDVLVFSGTTYTVTVTENVTIKITAGKQDTYTVQLANKADGYSISDIKIGDKDSEPATEFSVKTYRYGDEVSFKLTLAEGYSNSTPVVNVNGSALVGSKSGNDYTYTFKVTGATTISVTGVAKNTYSVTLPASGTGYTVAALGSTTVQHGGSVKFTVTVADGYDVNNVNVSSVTAGEKLIKSSTDSTGNVLVYEIKDISSDISDIKINNVNLNKYDVEAPTGGEGKYTFNFTNPTQLENNSVKVNHGGNATFTVTPNAGYRIVSVFKDVNGAKTPLTSTGTTADGNTYQATNITAETNIEVNVELVTFTITVINRLYTGHETETIEVKVTDEADVHKDYGISIEGGKIKLDAPKNSYADAAKGAYTLDKWIISGVVAYEYGKISFGTDNKSFTIEAQWKIDWSKLITIKDFGHKYEKVGPIGTLTYTFTAVEFNDKVPDTIDGRIVRAGILAVKSEHKNLLEDDTIRKVLGDKIKFKDTPKNQKLSGFEAGFDVSNATQSDLLAYYYNIDLLVAGFSSLKLTQKFNANADDDALKGNHTFAVGFVEVELSDGTHVFAFSDDVDEFPKSGTDYTVD